jgi:hypothetical protein
LRLAERTNFLFSLLKEAVTGVSAGSYSPVGVSICSPINLQAKWNPGPAGDDVTLVSCWRALSRHRGPRLDFQRSALQAPPCCVCGFADYRPNSDMREEKVEFEPFLPFSLTASLRPTIFSAICAIAFPTPVELEMGFPSSKLF